MSRNKSLIIRKNNYLTTATTQRAIITTIRTAKQTMADLQVAYHAANTIGRTKMIQADIIIKHKLLKE